MGTLIQTPLNGRERHCINGAGWTAEETRVMLNRILSTKLKPKHLVCKYNEIKRVQADE